MDLSAATTSPLRDKALWLAVMTPILAAVGNKTGLNLDPVSAVALVMPVVIYIISHKWKTAVLSKAIIAAANDDKETAAKVAA